MNITNVRNYLVYLVDILMCALFSVVFLVVAIGLIEKLPFDIPVLLQFMFFVAVIIFAALKSEMMPEISRLIKSPLSTRVWRMLIIYLTFVLELPQYKEIIWCVMAFDMYYYAAMRVIKSYQPKNLMYERGIDPVCCMIKDDTPEENS